MPILAIQHRFTKNDYMLKLCHFRPPPGCLQYLFGSEGTLQTFNFASGNGHLLDQDYSICIRQETGLYTLHTKFENVLNLKEMGYLIILESTY